MKTIEHKQQIDQIETGEMTMLNQFKKFSAEQKYDGFCSYEWSNRVIVRGKQTFAVFGELAYDVTKQKFTVDNQLPGTGKLCVAINGKYLAQFPDEGQSGIMGMYIISRNGKKIKSEPTFVPCGWLYTSELDLTNAEIAENIIDDVIDGKNVFTTAPAGW
jgi:hypothetical protein